MERTLWDRQITVRSGDIFHILPETSCRDPWGPGILEDVLQVGFGPPGLVSRLGVLGPTRLGIPPSDIEFIIELIPRSGPIA